MADERAELLDPEPLYLRRPDAAVPGRAEEGVVIASRCRPTDVDALAALEADLFGVGRLVGRRRSRDELTGPRRALVVVDDDAASSGYVGDAGWPATSLDLHADRGAPGPRGGAASAAPRCSRGRRDAAPTGCCSR